MVSWIVHLNIMLNHNPAFLLLQVQKQDDEDDDGDGGGDDGDDEEGKGYFLQEAWL